MRTVLALGVAAVGWFAADWVVDRVDALFLFEVPVKVLSVFAALGLAERVQARLHH